MCEEEHELSTREACCEDTEAQWRCRIKAHSREIAACLNPLELMPYFDNHELLSADDKEVLLNDTLTRRKKVHFILDALETVETRDAYTKFFKCISEEVLRGEGIHIGHQYLLAVLKGQEYAPVDECRASEACRQRIREHHKDMRDIDLSSLVPVMYESSLITTDECDMLIDTSRTRIKRIEKLFLILETKGPLAHTIFAQCLAKETSHSSHAELHRKVTMASRKRKVSDELELDCPVPKRIPARLWMEEPLRGERYSEFVTDIRACYRSSSWAKLENVAQDFILANKDPQLIAMATIEKGYSFSCRRGLREKALKVLGEAWCMARQIDGSNRYFLMARCKHIRATIHRYLGDEGKSLRENEEAFDLLFNCERADDASRVMYGKACARLEKLGKTPQPTPQEVMDIEDSFSLAIVYGRNGNPGMCASEARCLIRLAQLALGTTTHGVCVVTATPENIKRAKGYLDQVDVNSVSQRCSSLYYVIESDLFKSMGNTTKAIESTEKALKVAKEAQLGAERHFAESRLRALK